METFVEFYNRDSQYARTGKGPTVAGADGMKPPTQKIKTKALGDSRFTGFDDIPVMFPDEDDIKREKLKRKKLKRKLKKDGRHKTDVQDNG